MKDPDYLNLMGKYNREEINFEKYLKDRGLYKANKLTKLNEVKALINGNPNILNLFLSKVSIGVRCLVMKAIFDLTDRQIEDNVRHVRSVIGGFIKENLEIVKINENPDANSTRNFSADFIRELSIIFDLPYRFLADQYAEYKLINTFEEYERINIRLLSLKELIEETSLVMHEKHFNRKIYGIKLINSFFENRNAKYFYTRVDIRKQFITIEIYLENSQVTEMITLKKILNILKNLDVRGKVYYRDAFLRDYKKLIILIGVEGNFIHPSYLSEQLLLEKQIF
ncbi:hypothetical protein ACFSO7_07160 [Bacillus sp. CGMCC 1.16607]|uniref:hypothetical protein n=1 Tax=Bacillus sp. CGMCC 1.16607 TaxID=3351842 RepID=UPI003629A08A